MSVDKHGVVAALITPIKLDADDTNVRSDGAVVPGASWNEQLDTMLTRLSQTRGTGAARADGGRGRVLPLATAHDALDVLAGFVAGLKAAIIKAQGDFGDRVPNQQYDGDGDGVIGELESPDPDRLASIKTSNLIGSISVDEYLAGVPTSIPSVRKPLNNLLYSFQPAVWNSVGGSVTDNGIPAARQAVADYQRAVNAVSGAIGTYADTTMPAAQCSACFGAMSALAASLDALHDFVAPTLGDLWRGGAHAALAASEQTVKDAAHAAGQIAAEGANLAGQGLGEFFKGFFSNSTTIALVVAGAVVYYYK